VCVSLSLTGRRVLTRARRQFLEPQENWDDDFEFQPNSPANTSTQLGSHSALTGELRANASNKNHDLFTDGPQASTSATTLENTHVQPPFAVTENWDDDFEDKTDSPGKKTPSRKTYKRSLASRAQAQETENWDDDFEIHSSAGAEDDDHFLDHDHSDDDDDMELGFADKDEDRTVTARSRREGTSHPNHNLNSTPPPPVPPIPFALLSQTDLGGHDQPFPHSPATSVFSAPSLGSGRDSVAFSYYHNNSTTHLRPTVSRSTLGGLSNLPPSPPIHKERERRRLRKKSRPHPEAVYELVDLKAPAELPQESENTAPRVTPPSTPPPTNGPSLPLSPPSNSRRHSVTISSSPPTKTPLLSRIGSVKRKWAVRKNRASSTPSEVSLNEIERSPVAGELRFYQLRND
jgi:serine/arginine repetitive matrix protein 2